MDPICSYDIDIILNSSFKYTKKLLEFRYIILTNEPDIKKYIKFFEETNDQNLIYLYGKVIYKYCENSCSNNIDYIKIFSFKYIKKIDNKIFRYMLLINIFSKIINNLNEDNKIKKYFKIRNVYEKKLNIYQPFKKNKMKYFDKKIYYINNVNYIILFERNKRYYYLLKKDYLFFLILKK